MEPSLVIQCLIGVLLTSSVTSETCKPSGIHCLNPIQYQLCVTVSGIGIVGDQIYTCPASKICDDSGICPCADGPVPPITTTLSPVPKCFNAGKFAAPSCHQYYECVPVMWWWVPRLRNCTDGTTFDVPSGECINAGLIDCKPTTTTPEPVTPPACTKAGVYPAPEPNQYYRCKYVWFKWKRYLMTCPYGQVFSRESQGCVSPAEIA